MSSCQKIQVLTCLETNTKLEEKEKFKFKASDLQFATLAIGGALIAITFEIAGELIAALHNFSPDENVREFGVEVSEHLYIQLPYGKREREREQLGIMSPSH